MGHRLRLDRAGAGARQARQGTRRRGPAGHSGRARDRLGNRLFLAEPGPDGRDRAARRDGHLAGHAVHPVRQRPTGSGSRWRRRSPTRRSCRSRTESFDLVFGHAVLHHIPDLDTGAPGVPARPSARRGASPSAASRRATGTCWRRCRSAAPSSRRRCGGSPSGRPRAGRSPSGERRPRAGAGGRRARLRALRAQPACWTLPASRTSGSSARSCWRTPSAGRCGRSRAPRSPTRSRCGGGSSRFRGYLALQRVDTAMLEPRLPPSLFYNLVLSARKPAA